MTLDGLFGELWDGFVQSCPRADVIHRLLEGRGEAIVNDHIALRTFESPTVGLARLAGPFVRLGYEKAGEYDFPAKRLRAHHYEHPDPRRPRVFVSELQMRELSRGVRRIVARLLEQVPPGARDREDLPVLGRPWTIPWATYEALRAESEYAAWLGAFGFRANHFTIDVGRLESFRGLSELTGFLRQEGFPLNDAGGVIKGSEIAGLEQAATFADDVDVQFSDGLHRIPGCYYEFAHRFGGFGGFVASSADKLVHSTDRRATG